ncbi:hypothetical protein [Spirosoma foliorum]|uniref:Uncharacterized protein n=1 Tax=Spirosoma foliorum TaxID=2710596 RepID=A0A7G5H2G2_9BACT|nr:hypothetical protein [Spirosoma foliorum]QMW05304.1 hypothetical protein H3H32_10665 [Spirosoma foliorum]
MTTPPPPRPLSIHQRVVITQAEHGFAGSSATITGLDYRDPKEPKVWVLVEGDSESYPFSPEQLQGVSSRGLGEITEAEARECFKVAFGSPLEQYAMSGVSPEEGAIEIYAYEKDGERIDITILSDGQMAATAYYPDQRMFSPFFNAPALVRYLESIGVKFIVD